MDNQTNEETVEPNLSIEPSLKPLVLRGLMHSYNASFYTILGFGLVVLIFLFAPLYANNWNLQQILDPYISIIVASFGIPVGLCFWLSSKNRQARKEIDKNLYPEISTQRTEDVDTDKLIQKMRKFKTFFETNRTATLIRIRNIGLLFFIFELALVIVLLTENLAITPSITVYLALSGIGLTLCLISHLLIPPFYRKDLLKLSLEANLN